MLLVAHRSPVAAPACLRLAEAGATVFEIDLQLIGEEIVVSHFLRVGFGPRRLRREGWRFRARRDERREPELSQLISRLPAGARVLLDLKETAAGRRSRLLAGLDAALPERARFIVCTSNAADLSRSREVGFRTWRTIGDRHELAAVLAEGPLPDDAVTARHTLLDEAGVERLHSVAPQVVAWTVNDVRRALRLRDLGVDGITTDSLDVLRALADVGS